MIIGHRVLDNVGIRTNLGGVNMEFGGNDWNNDGVYDHLDSYMDYELSKTSDKSCNSSGGAIAGTSTEMMEQHTRVKNTQQDSQEIDVSIIICFVLGYVVEALFLKICGVDFWALPVLLFVFFGANLGVWIWVIYKLVTGLGEA